MMTVRELFSKIIDAAPGFKRTMEEHLSDNDELLSHLLMADCGLFVASYFTGEKRIASDPPSVVELRNVLAIIDAALAEGDEEAQNVVAVSFVECLWLEPYYTDLCPFLGSKVRDEIERQRAWSPGAG